MAPWLVAFPQAREAPVEIRRQLRALDPTAEVIYLGPRQWVVGRVRPNREVVRVATAMLDNTAGVLTTAARNSHSRRLRVALALLALQGFRPVQEYALNDLDGRVVADFERSRFLMLHQSDGERLAELEERTATSELGSLDLAKEAWQSAFTSRFGYGVSSIAKPEHVPTSRTRHLSISA